MNSEQEKKLLELIEKAKDINPLTLTEMDNDIHKILKNNKFSTKDVVKKIIDDNLSTSLYCFLLNNFSDNNLDINIIDELVVLARAKMISKNYETSSNRKLVEDIRNDLNSFEDDIDKI